MVDHNFQSNFIFPERSNLDIHRGCVMGLGGTLLDSFTWGYRWPSLIVNFL
jgi:hypothetical protein